MRAHNFSLRVVELIGHIRNARGPSRVHHSKKIEIDLELRVIGVLHVFVDKEIGDQGGAQICLAVNREQCTNLPYLSGGSGQAHRHS